MEPCCGRYNSSHETMDELTPAPRSRWYHNTWFVLLMLSPLALGPFGLPLLWKSPKFSQGAKLWLTTFTLAWTALAVWYVVGVVVPAVSTSINQFNATLKF